VSASLVTALTILLSLVILLLVGLLIHRDMQRRGVDPVPVLVLTFVFTPIGLVLWLVKRHRNPVKASGPGGTSTS